MRTSTTGRHSIPLPAGPGTACGSLPFNDVAADTGTATLVWSLDTNYRTQYQYWERRLRANADAQLTKATMLLSILSNDTVSGTWKVPTQQQHDYAGFGFQHNADSSQAKLLLYTDAVAQLWRLVNKPDSLRVVPIGASTARLTWTNRHGNRSVDSTAIYREAGSGWSLRRFVGPTVIQWDDSNLASGVTYRYFLRHVTALLFQVNDGNVARPNSEATAADSVRLTPPPTSLICQGNFAPTIDCTWSNADPTAQTQIFREPDTVPKATLAPGVTTWTDQAVTRGSSYTYKVRHVKSGMPGGFGPLFATVANPVPPQNLSCGGTGQTTVGCAWWDQEADTVEIWHSQTDTLDYQIVATSPPLFNQFNDSGLKRNTTYWYKIRYQRNGDHSGYSNHEDARTGQIEPYRPVGP